MFQAIERWCRVPGGGYSGVADVNVVPPVAGGSFVTIGNVSGPPPSTCCLAVTVCMESTP